MFQRKLRSSTFQQKLKEFFWSFFETVYVFEVDTKDFIFKTKLDNATLGQKIDIDQCILMGRVRDIGKPEE